MNWQHFQTFLWLRWRLFLNQLRRGGTTNAVVQGILAAGVLVLAALLTVVLFLSGIALADEGPAAPMYVWDGIVVAFVFFWSTGLLVELQRSEVLSLDKFLHLPVSLKSAFLINYVSSLFSVTLILFVPPMISFAVALAFAFGPKMLVLLPLVAAFLLLVTALTYQFQGWLAALMVNKRRRRTVIVIVTVVFILVCQVPNLVNILHPWKQQHENQLQVEQQKEEIAVEQDAALKRITEHERQERLKEIRQKYANLSSDANRRQNEGAAQTVELVNMIVPLGWLPFGAREAADGRLFPAVLATVGFTAVGAASLWRSYRTTLRLYTGYYTSGKRAPAVDAVAPVTAADLRPLLLEKQLPWLSEPAAAVALGSFRSLLRAPEAKMILLSPLMMILVFGSLSLAHTMEPKEEMKPLMAFGAMSMTMFSLIQLVGNQFGFDRSGFRVYVLSAAPRRDILLGKNLSTAPIAFGMGLTMVVFLQVLYPMRLDHFLATVPQLLSTYLLFCMLANWLSILAPTAVRSGTFRAANPKGLTLLLQLLFLFLFPLVLIPILIPLAVEQVVGALTPFASVPISLVLSVMECLVILALYRAMLTWQGAVLQGREQKILEIVTTKTE